MADEVHKSPPIKVKRERQDLLHCLAAATSSAANNNANSSRLQGFANNRQPKITQYFTDHNKVVPIKKVAKEEPDDDAGRKSPALDIESAKGRFGWTTLGSVHIPFLLRKDERFAAVRIIEGKLLKKFLQALPQDVYSCTYIKSYFITETEAKLLNEINSQHCDYQFGYDPFTPKDLVVPLGDARQFFEFLETCYSRLVDPSSHATNRCGFIKLNGAVVPYVLRDGAKYVPLPFIEQELQALKTNAEKLESWELSYLKFCCKVAGIDGDVLNNQGCPVVCLDALKEQTDSRVFFEDWWPAGKDSAGGMGLDGCRKRMNVTGVSPNGAIPKSIFQPPPTVSSSPKNHHHNHKRAADASPKCKSPSPLPLPGSSSREVEKEKERAASNCLSPGYPASGNLPYIGSCPWPAPQSFMFNSQWWGPIASQLLPTFSTSAKTDMFLPTLIPSPNFNLEKLLQQVQTSSYPSHQKDKQQSPNSSSPKACKRDRSPPTSDSRPPPPPLVKNHSNQGADIETNGSRLQTSHPKVAHCNRSSTSDSTLNVHNVRASTSEKTDTFRTSQVENRVAAPGMTHSGVKQTSPKPANPVPTIGGGVTSPFLSRPPPPLVSVANLSSYTSSPHYDIPYCSRQSKTGAQDSLNLIAPMISPSTVINRPFMIPEPTFTVTADGRPPYKLQLLTVDGKQLPVINGQPYTYASPYLAAIQDLVVHLFPNTSCTCFQQVVSDVLAIKLYSSNRLQQEAYLNQSNINSCYGLESSSLVLMQVEDLNNYMPHLKYMFSRMDSTRSELNQSVLTTGSILGGYGHTPKRIRL
uniref:Uncharacterized protein n=1 Tax=Strigamia maritima TaxID=126957 RepID=T1JET0_STRMM